MATSKKTLRQLENMFLYTTHIGVEKVWHHAETQNKLPICRCSCFRPWKPNKVKVSKKWLPQVPHFSKTELENLHIFIKEINASSISLLTRHGGALLASPGQPKVRRLTPPPSNYWLSSNLDVTFKISLAYLMPFPAIEGQNLVAGVGMKTMKTLQTVSSLTCDFTLIL